MKKGARNDIKSVTYKKSVDFVSMLFRFLFEVNPSGWLNVVRARYKGITKTSG